MSGPESQAGRCIAHVDLDAFYCQVEVKRFPHLEGKPSAVTQYNPFGDLSTVLPEDNRIYEDNDGAIIAVSYEARAQGVKRAMRGKEARKKCPELQLVQVPLTHGKAELGPYRAAGKQVLDILARLSIAERASIDECYLDITQEASKRLAASSGHPALPINLEQVHVCGKEARGGAAAWWARPPEAWGPGQRLLACGAQVIAELRAAVREELGYSCSAGVAHNKILAKFASGMHKPAQQTVVTLECVPGLMAATPIPKLRQLGGKFGEEIMHALQISTVGELAAVPMSRLEAVCKEQDAKWLHRLSLGIDDEEVKPRKQPQSIGCGKTFRGASALRAFPLVHTWLLELAKELEERIAEDREEHARLPRLLTVGMWGEGGPGTSGGSISRSCPLHRPEAQTMAADALQLIKRWAASTPGWAITSLFMTASKFDSAPTGSSTIMRFLKPKGSPEPAAHGPALPAAGPSGQAGTLCGDLGLAAATSAEAETAGSRRAGIPKAAESLHSPSGGPVHDSAEPGEAAARSTQEGLSFIGPSAGASIRQHPSNGQLDRSAGHSMEDAGSRDLQMSHCTSSSSGYEPQQHLPEGLSRAVPAHEPPRHDQGILQQVSKHIRLVEAVQASRAVDEVLHGSACTPSEQGHSAFAIADQIVAAPQHVQASHDSQVVRSDAAKDEVSQDVAREAPGSKHPDSRMAGGDEDGTIFQTAAGSDEAEMERARERRHQSMRKGEGEAEPSRPSHLSYQDIDPEVLAALPKELRRELEIEMLQQSSRRVQKSRPAPASSRSATKRGKPSRGSTPITSFYSRAKAG